MTRAWKPEKSFILRTAFTINIWTAWRRRALIPAFAPDSGLKIVYTPLNGAGNKLVRKILARDRR